MEDECDANLSSRRDAEKSDFCVTSVGLRDSSAHFRPNRVVGQRRAFIGGSKRVVFQLKRGLLSKLCDTRCHGHDDVTIVTVFRNCHATNIRLFGGDHLPVNSTRHGLHRTLGFL